MVDLGQTTPQRTTAGPWLLGQLGVRASPGQSGPPHRSLARLQLEFGAELGRAVRNFQSPLLFVVLSRYHGGAYVVFSKALNSQLKAVALQGSYASVIGGAPAAAVVFTREVDRRAQESGDRVAAQAEVAAEFDAIHTVQRAQAVGSLDAILELGVLRPWVIENLMADLRD
jgi:acetyl-CoA carboxylase carboxyltransferase component